MKEQFFQTYSLSKVKFFDRDFLILSEKKSSFLVIPNFVPINMSYGTFLGQVR